VGGYALGLVASGLFVLPSGAAIVLALSLARVATLLSLHKRSLHA
jgi:hypothetical protein